MSTCLRVSSGSLAESNPRDPCQTRASTPGVPGSPLNELPPPVPPQEPCLESRQGGKAGFPLRREMEILAPPNNGWDGHQNRSSGSPRHGTARRGAGTGRALAKARGWHRGTALPDLTSTAVGAGPTRAPQKRPRAVTGHELINSRGPHAQPEPVYYFINGNCPKRRVTAMSLAKPRLCGSIQQCRGCGGCVPE